MDARGWIKLHRQIWSCDLWQSKEPFDERRAWIDMILLCNHADADIYIGKNSIHIERGQFFTSVRHLADRWHWSKSKTDRYLGHLSRRKSIHKAGLNGGTLITLVNYGFFQDGRDSCGDTNRDSNRDANGVQTINKRNTNNTRKYSDQNPFKQFEQNKYTEDEYEKLFAN